MNYPIGAIMVMMWDIMTGKQDGWSLANFFETYAYLCYLKIRGNGLVYKTKEFSFNPNKKTS